MLKQKNEASCEQQSALIASINSAFLGYVSYRPYNLLDHG